MLTDISDEQKTVEKNTVDMPHRTRKISFLLGVLFTVILIGTVQIGLWIYGLIYHSEFTIISKRIDLNRIMQSDPDTFWSLMPNMKNEEFFPQPGGPPHGFHVSTNELALRNPPIKAKGDRLRILAIGDSTTFGQYVEDNESWPAQLQAMLDKSASKVEVINAGLIGATSFQGLSYLLKRGFDLKPDIVISTYGFNELGQWRFSDRIVAPDLGIINLEEMLNPFFQKRHLAISKNTSRVSAGEFLDVLLIMASECESRNIKLYFNIWPSPCDSSCDWKVFAPNEYKSLIVEAAFRSHAKVIDLRQPFHDAPENPFVDVVHASPLGCRIAAQTIASTLNSALDLHQVGSH